LIGTNKKEKGELRFAFFFFIGDIFSCAAVGAQDIRHAPAGGPFLYGLAQIRHICLLIKSLPAVAVHIPAPPRSG
jgi:hypothetical protein